MSTLRNFTSFLGRAIHLPPFFYREVPFGAFLDKGIQFNAFGRTSSSTKRFRSRARGNQRRRPCVGAAKNTVLEGVINEGDTTRFSINGIDFCLSAGTWIIGDPYVGCSARVKGIRGNDDVVLASSLVVLQ